MSSTEYQDDPWGRHGCQAPRRNGFLFETGGAARPGFLARMRQLFRMLLGHA